MKSETCQSAECCVKLLVISFGALKLLGRKGVQPVKKTLPLIPKMEGENQWELTTQVKLALMAAKVVS